ncbi:MAG: methanogenesis marker protein Mmp4/MtxX [Methanomassiliicoccales archaeon]|nr:MAG: methanogenesis marker protein Mmp4/MtxX [Methanomassiliicoccales archaeon]
MAKKTQATIGIGSDEKAGIGVVGIKRARKEKVADVKVFHDAQKLVSALKNGAIDGAVRGSLGSKAVLGSLKSEFGVKKTLRTALLATKDDRLVLLAPVGVDEGQNPEEKMELILLGSELMAKFGAKPKIAILSGGRLEDQGRHPKVDETLIESQRLTDLALEKGFDVKHMGILLENAFEASNFVVPFDGITGNLIFRARHFFGGTKSFGAPVVNIPRVFVDTSRAKRNYFDSIVLASALCGL